MPRITHAQQQELEQKQEQALADRAKIADQHVSDIKKIEAQVKVVAAEHDAVIAELRTRIEALEAERNELRVSLHAETELQIELRQELSEERTANQALLADLRELRRRGEASLNYLTASLLAAFGVAVAAVGYSRCQEPEL